MSLNRAAVRLATVLALSNNFKDPFPTLAGQNVYDSRNEPPSQINDDELVPTITIYTDDDEGQGDQNSLLEFERKLDLVIECYCPVWGMQQVDSGEVDENNQPIMVAMPVMNMPDTDAELEANLDLLEHQVRFALRNPLNPWLKYLFGAPDQSGVIAKVNSWDSGRWAEAKEARVRFAYRIIKLEIVIADDCPPKQFTQDGEPQVIYALPSAIKGLLDAVEQDLDESGEMSGHVKPLVEMLRAVGTPAGTTARPLRKMALTAGLSGSPSTVQTQITDLDQ